MSAQRALELADKLDKFMHEEVLTVTMGDVAASAAILRHYAEIMQDEGGYASQYDEGEIFIIKPKPLEQMRVELSR